MQRKIFQLIILFLLAACCLSGFLLVRHLLEFPFRSTNDALHKKDSAFDLDFLIPSGRHLDERITIRQVITIRYRKERSFYEKVLRSLFDLVPAKFQYVADLLLFLFWSLCFMSFFRVFTFMGYSRTLRVSFLFGGITYYFMPDFSPGNRDDMIFVGFPLFLILLRSFIQRRRKRRKLLEE